MSAFSGAFSSAFYVSTALDLNVTASRLAVEELGTYREGLVLRITAESLDAPLIWAGTVTRVTGEALFENIPLAARVSREVVEVLAEEAYSLPEPNVTITRAVAEMLGLAASTEGKKADTVRMVAEALVSMQTRSTGLQMPSVSLDAVSVYMAVTLNVAEGPGYLGFRDEKGDGFSLTWPGGGTTVTKTWTHGAASTSSTFTYTGGIAIVDFKANGTGTPALMTDFGTLKPYGNEASGQVHELLLFNQNVTAAKNQAYKDYLSCKWVEAGCTDLKTPCDERIPEPGDHFYTCTAGSFADAYYGYVDGTLTGGTPVGSVTPNDGNLLGVITSIDGAVRQLILGLASNEALTTATISVTGGATYTNSGAVTDGASLGLPFPYVFYIGEAGSWPDLVDGATFTVDIH